jgi:hypothetical protein
LFLLQIFLKRTDERSWILASLEVGETFFKLLGKDKRICQFEKSDDSYMEGILRAVLYWIK